MDTENLRGVVIAKIPIIKQRMLIHDEKYRTCNRWNKILSAIHIVLTSIMSSLTSMQLSRREDYITFLIMVCGWLIALVTGIISFTKLPNTVDSHRQAVLLYSGILEQIEELKLINGETDPKLLTGVLKEYRRLKRIVPYIKESIKA